MHIVGIDLAASELVKRLSEVTSSRITSDE